MRTLIITFFMLLIAHLHHCCYMFGRITVQVNGFFEIRKNIGKGSAVKIRTFAYHVVFPRCHDVLT